MDWWMQIQPLLQKIQAALGERHQTVATAESCTGGLVATLLTHLAGSSAVYIGGVSAYANEAKVSLLGVASDVLAHHGAVSAPVAEQMARGIRERLNTTYAISLTGIAGPGGGSSEKPVGTVYCGIASPHGVKAVRLSLAGDRREIRRGAAEGALRTLYQEIIN